MYMAHGLERVCGVRADGWGRRRRNVRTAESGCCAFKLALALGTALPGGVPRG
jgi:hypothetical protein